MEKEEFRAWIFFIMIAIVVIKGFVKAAKYNKRMNNEKYYKNKN